MTNLLNADGPQPMPNLDALFDSFPGNQRAKKATSKGIASTICVNNLIFRKKVHWEHFRPTIWVS
jgi:hypothetical protein